MYDLSDFGLGEMTLLGAELRKIGAGYHSLEDASQAVARRFVEVFTDPHSGGSAIVLARCYKTHPLADLPADLESFARALLPGEELHAATPCLTLLGTFGDQPAWRSRAASNGHRAIPLSSETTVESLPMVSRLTRALGLRPADVVRPDPKFLLEKDRQGFNVFHVEQAVGSPYIPAQLGFVIPNGVRSVVGFGFVLPPTSVFATILFCRVHVTSAAAGLFKTLALSLKLALLPLAARPAFGPGPS